MSGANSQKGFTIVELLIVVVVIAILAAITIVSYNGISNRAKTSALTSDVANAIRQVEVSKAQGGVDTYPDPQTTTLKSSTGVTMTYLLPTAQTYCVSATKDGMSYGAATGAKPAEGSCVVNIVKNPKGTGVAGNYNSSGWFTALGTTTDTPSVSWNGRSDWHRFVWTGSGNGIRRLYVDQSDLQNTQYYTASVLVANPGTATASFSMDFSDMNTTVFSFAAGESRRVSVGGARATYDATFRFIDVDAGPVNANGLLFTDAMLSRTDAMVGFGDGDAAGWAWTGTAGASKSTGPSL